ncbi:MAG TPA: prolyl oligopeptidase family serine peptidase [Chitinophagaceae bacterium]|nr:prolyl oligopeptidase family serine peptidase [Chitinophagaceae bacterium]HRA12168.1 prolyl oligopeptidase family serine peptidase [Chitinophagaceae bacterium]
MKKLLSLSIMIIPCIALAQVQYPTTKKSDIVEDYHGTKVADPYRWLEDDNSEETKAWVAAQNKVTDDYLATIPFRNNVKKRLEELWNYPKYSSPFKEGEYYYFFKNDGLQNQSVAYRQMGLDGSPEVFLDPNKLSDDGTAALAGISFSKTSKYLVYSVSQSGSDWQTGYIMDVKTKKKTGEQLNWLKFTGFSWKGDDGFYYSRYPEPKEGDELKGKNESSKVYYHQLGTTQTEDVLIYEDKEHPLRFVGVGLTEDERFLILSTSEGTSGSEIWYKDLKDPSQKEFSLLIPGFTTEPSIVDNVDDKLLLLTNEDAPNYKLVLVDPKNPAKENWKLVIPEKKEVLQGVSTGGGSLFSSYLKDASTRVYQHSYDGKLIRNIELPGIGTAGGFGGKKEEKEFFYTFTSFNYPPTIFRYDVATGKSSLFRKTETKFDPTGYETKQIFFKSKDGTKVPMFVSHKKGLKLDGTNPVLLYGYGGFNIPMTPGFSISNAFFMEQGGVYVQVNLRGGSEYGEDWHKAGMLEKKQNVFDDFIGAAETLIKEKYTNKDKIAIRGGSNGGLLVGAAMTQRPDLFKVAIPQVGVMDMLRYHKFTIGYAWAVEYGSSDKKEDFDYLYKYSPVHNLKSGINYPATIVTTADHDDRVVPAHSFKFAAALQAVQAGANPTLIRIESKAGHGAGKPTSKQIEEATDIWSFTMQNLGMQYKDPVKKGF